MPEQKNEYKEEKIVMSDRPMNFDHPSPKIKKMLNDRMHFLINTKTKEEFFEFCKPYGGTSKVLRDFIESSLKNKK